MGKPPKQTGNQILILAFGLFKSSCGACWGFHLHPSGFGSDPSSRTLRYPPHPRLPVEEGRVSAEHPLPPPLSADRRRASSSDGYRGWSGSADPTPGLQVAATYNTEFSKLSSVACFEVTKVTLCTSATRLRLRIFSAVLPRVIELMWIHLLVRDCTMIISI